MSARRVSGTAIPTGHITEGYHSGASAEIMKNMAERIATLTDAQRRALNLALEGENVFLTGGSGCGKTYLLNILVERLTWRGKYVAATAPTGIASTHISGQTLHSFAGVGDLSRHPSAYTTKALSNPYLREAWCSTDTLIIDEISFLSARALDKLDYMARRIRKAYAEPFGGLQVIVCGDFYQLPPVHEFKGRAPQCPDCGATGHNIKWKNLGWHQLDCYGDCADPHLGGEDRVKSGPGAVTDSESGADKDCNLIVRDPESGGAHEWNVEAVKVDTRTKYAFEAASWKALDFEVVQLDEVFRQSDPKFVKTLNELRIGNLTPDGARLLNSRVRANRTTQDGIKPTRLYPLRIDIKRYNEIKFNKLPGEIHRYYASDKKVVAMTARTLRELDIEPDLRPDGTVVADDEVLNVERKTNPQESELLDTALQVQRKLDLKIGTQVVLLYNLDVKGGLVNGSRGVVTRFEHSQDGRFELPVVKFVNGREEAIKARRFDSRLSDGTVAWRRQIPLLHGWALTIHKAQGMSLDYAAMDVSCVFDVGQAYVAISRVRSLEGLVLEKPLRPHLVRADKRVEKYYRQLRESQATKQESRSEDRVMKRDGEIEREDSQDDAEKITEAAAAGGSV